MGLVSLKEEEERPELFLSPPMWGHSERAAIYKPRRGLSPGTDSAGILILDFSGSGTVRNKFLLFKPPSLWHFVIAAWTMTVIFPVIPF